jgi:shikimate dehydrogenase
LKFLLVGHPVAHSLSPVIHRAAYRELGERHEYGLLDAEDEATLHSIAAALRAGELSGVNITVPWKRKAFAMADSGSPLAKRLHVANVLAFSGGQLVAHNTDALALEREFRALPNVSRAIVLGSGGAAPAVIAACQAAGISEVYVTARRFQCQLPKASWSGASELAALGAMPVAWPASGAPAAAVFQELARTSQLVVQSTSAGMHGADSGEPLASMVPWADLPSQAVAYDLVYAPLETPFLRAARQAGLRAEHGLGMLIEQALLSIEIWLGRRPAAEPLLAAAQSELLARGRH